MAVRPRPTRQLRIGGTCIATFAATSRRTGPRKSPFVSPFSRCRRIIRIYRGNPRMTTTLQQLQDRAVAFSSANGLSSLVSDRSEIINRIAGFERDVYDLATRQNRYFFAVSVPVTST